MGNKIARLTESIDESYTRPQGSYEYKGDFRKLRRLILSGQLAPCYPGAEDYSPELDGCPICFLFYPSLNKSKCCSKPICTECYLQIKSTGVVFSIQCPFCKTSNYMVEFHGARTAKEKEFELAEEQKVIEAKIRNYQKELEDQKQRWMRGREDTLAGEVTLESAREHGLNDNSRQFDRLQSPFEHDSICFRQHDSEDEWYLQEFSPQSSREGETGLEMDDVMLMRAIWLSIHDQGEGNQENSVAQQNVRNETMIGIGLRRRKTGRFSGLGGIAAIRNQLASGSQQTNHQSVHEQQIPTDITLVKSQNSHTRSDAIRIPQRFLGASRSALENEEATSGLLQARKLCPQPQPEFHGQLGGLGSAVAPTMPENFEEQIMLAMALSLADAEAQAR